MSIRDNFSLLRQQTKKYYKWKKQRKNRAKLYGSFFWSFK